MLKALFFCVHPIIASNPWSKCLVSFPRLKVSENSVVRRRSSAEISSFTTPVALKSIPYSSRQIKEILQGESASRRRHIEGNVTNKSPKLPKRIRRRFFIFLLKSVTIALMSQGDLLLSLLSEYNQTSFFTRSANREPNAFPLLIVSSSGHPANSNVSTRSHFKDSMMLFKPLKAPPLQP